MSTNEIEIDTATDDGDMAVVITEPETVTSDTNTIGLFIDAPGLRLATREFMHRLSAQGYRVVTPDLHHRHGRLMHYEPAQMAVDPDVGKTIMEWIVSKVDDEVQHDMDCALRAAKVSEQTPIAVIGFCLGARAVYRSLERHPERVLAGAGWHPSFLVDKPGPSGETGPGESGEVSPHLSAAALTRPLYLGIGEADKIQSIEAHQPFLDQVASLDHVTVRTFAGADHGFSFPGYSTYHQEAAETSWTLTLEMFASAFASANESDSH